jgi:hypothetical protein
MSVTDQIIARIKGRRVVQVDGIGDSRLTLDDGTVLELYMSESDCCASAAGEWVIQPDALEAIITNVTVAYDLERSGYDGDTVVNYATITILHNQNPIALAECSANAGNGNYYFSALSLAVRIPPGRFQNLDLGDAEPSYLSLSSFETVIVDSNERDDE